MRRVVAALLMASPLVAAFTGPAALGLRRPATRTSGLCDLCMADRRPFIAGNWKMNPETLDEAKKLAAEIGAASSTAEAQVALMVPHTFMYSLGEVLKGSNVEIGAQSVYFEQKGAFTGAVSTCMVASVGAKHGLSGHSERRVIFENSDGDINKKTRKLIAQGINPMLCIGESKDEYEGGLNTAVCASQLSKDLQGVTKEEMKMVTIAYEPVWAIGTGLTCDPEQAQKVHEFIRGWLAKMYDEEVAASTRILYGGSVTPETVDELMAKPDIDGCLVGGLSLVSVSPSCHLCTSFLSAAGCLVRGVDAAESAACRPAPSQALIRHPCLHVNTL